MDGLYFYKFNHFKEHYCIYCDTKAHKEPNESDYLWLTCRNCGRIYFLEPVDISYKDKYYQDLKLKLNSKEIDELIDIALTIRDRKWFDELLSMKKRIINGWAITPFRQTQIIGGNGQ